MAHTIAPEKTRATLYIVLIFLCGALAGVAGTNLWVHGWLWGSSASADAPSYPTSTQNRVERFTRELSLNPDQAKQLNQILDETHSTFLQIETQSEVVRKKGRDRIREILTPEQKTKYEQLLAHIDASRKRQHK